MSAALQRRTLAGPAAIEGVGLFTEQRVRCTILPARPGDGLAFLRTDAPGPARIPATVSALSSQPIHPAFARIPPRHTVLADPRNPGALVCTTEHVLGALAGLSITDALIELDGPEPPIGDGSAAHFVEAVERAGTRSLEAAIEPLTVHSVLTVRSDDGSAAITLEPLPPGERPSYQYHLDYGPGGPIPPHSAAWDASPDAFAERVARARTFSLRAEAAQMQALGLFRSFTPRDLLVIDDQGRPIENAWRSEDEPALHKLLDLVGDLALVGRPIHARITASRSGHALNHALARALAAQA